MEKIMENEKKNNLLNFKHNNDMVERCGAELIDSYSELKEKIFDITSLDVNNMPKITAKRKSILVLDSNNYNSCYLLDLFETNQTQLSINGVDLFYLNNVEIRYDLLHGRDELVDIDFTQPEFDKNLYPCLIFINPETDEIDMTVSNPLHIFSQIDINTIVEEFINGNIKSEDNMEKNEIITSGNNIIELVGSEEENWENSHVEDES